MIQIIEPDAMSRLKSVDEDIKYRSRYCSAYRKWKAKRYPGVTGDCPVARINDINRQNVSKKNAPANVDENRIYETYCEAFPCE